MSFFTDFTIWRRITKNILMLFNPQSRGFACQTSSVDKNVLSEYMCPFNKSMIAKCFDTLYIHGYFFKFMYDQDNKRIEQLVDSNCTIFYVHSC